MAITKPTVDSATWANTAAGPDDIATPGAGLFNTGFLSAVRFKRGYVNYWFNKLHQGLRYYMAQGIPAWDASETQYVVGSVVSYGGLCYILNVAAPSGSNPPADPTHWGLLVPTPSGLLLRETTITATGSLAAIAGCKRAVFRMTGAGGGALGISPASGPTIFGGGGGAGGSYGEFSTTAIPATWTFTLNAAGVGGAAPGAPGINVGTGGGSAVFSDGTNTFTCPGGGGSSSESGGLPGALPTATPGGTIRFAAIGQRGNDGTSADVATQSAVSSGHGGSTPFGSGGPGVAVLGFIGIDGVNGTGYGSGGGGPGAYTGAGKQGGSGKPCLILLQEWS